MHADHAQAPNFKRVIVAIVATLVGLVGLWVGAHVVRAIPPARWAEPTTESPPPDDNAALVIGSASFALSTDEEAMLSVDNDSFAEELARSAPELERTLALSAQVRADVASRPRFVPDLLHVDVMHLYELWKQRTLAIFVGCARGDLAAIAAARSLWIHTRDIGRHSHTLVMGVLSARLGELALDAIERVDETFGGAELPNDAMTELAMLHSTLAASDPTSWTLTPAIEAEYHFVRHAIVSSRCWPHDVHQSETISAAYFETLHELAEGRSPSELDRVETQRLEEPAGAFFWGYNRCGREVVETSTVAADDLIRRHIEKRNELAERIGRLIRRPPS